MAQRSPFTVLCVIFLALVLSVPPVVLPGSDDASGASPKGPSLREDEVWREVQFLETEVTLAPGGTHFFELDPTGLQVSEKEIPEQTAGLSQNALDALERTPIWVRDDLTKKFQQLSAADPDCENVSTTFYDIDGDEDLDCVIGTDRYTGQWQEPLMLFENVGTEWEPLFVYREGAMEFACGSIGSGRNPHPLLFEVNGNGLPDLMVGNLNGSYIIFWDLQKETDGHYTSLEQEGMYNILWDNPNPTAGDLDGDGDLDLVFGDDDGTLKYYENMGTATDPSWSYVPLEMASLYVSGMSAPTLGDIDGDGDLDLTVGEDDVPLHFFRNIGNPTNAIWAPDDLTMYTGITPGTRKNPELVDLDNNGVLDLVYGTRQGPLYQIHNKGTPEDPDWMTLSSYELWPGVAYYPRFSTLEVLGLDPSIDKYTSLISGITDTRLIDEVAFTIAHLPLEDLKGPYMLDQICLDNARYLYENDPYIPYADIVDHGSYASRDYYSTVRYKVNDNGNPLTRELTMDIYYWYIVHPKITEETPTYINPETGGFASPSNGGRFWRDYLFNVADPAYPEDPPTDPDEDGIPNFHYPKEETPPLLKDKLAQTNYLYDGVPYNAPRGYDNMGYNNTRPWGYRDHAIEYLGNWIGKTLPLNEQESNDGERPIQPVRIAHHHNGNCGELADLGNAGARTAMIPASSVGMSAEDHTWWEFWEGGSWHQIDNYWSDGGGVIDNFMNYWVGWGERGGSGVMKWIGDDSFVDVTDHYVPPDARSDTTVVVTDRNGNPVDGARVVLASHWLSEQQDLPAGATFPIPSIWNYTDADGMTHFSVCNNNFTIKVISHLGNAIQDKTYIEQGSTNMFSFQLEGSNPKPMPPSETMTIAEGDDFKVTINYEVLNATQYPPNANTGNYHPHRVPTGLHIDSHVVNEENLLAFLNGYGFEAKYVDLDVGSIRYDVKTPSEEHLYMAISNEDSLATEKVVYINLTAYVRIEDKPRVKIASPPDGDVLPSGDDFRISGYAIDDKVLGELTLSIYNDEGFFKDESLTADDIGSWEFYWDASSATPGFYHINITAKDSDGNVAEEGISLFLTDGDQPFLSIERPSHGDDVYVDVPVDISGKVASAYGIYRYTVESGENSINTFLVEGAKYEEYSFEWTPIEDDVGDVTINGTVEDMDGRISMTSITITVLSDEPPPVDDVVAPWLKIMAPSNGTQYETGDVVNISGSAYDDVELKDVTHVSGKGSGEMSFLPDSGIWWYLWETEDLDEDEYTHVFQARDLADNIAKRSITLFLTSAPTEEDRRDPDVEITSPESGTVFSLGEPVTITAEITDNTGIDHVWISFDNEGSWDDATYKLAEDSFSFTWETSSQEPGIYLTVVKAWDGSENHDSDQILIELRDDILPTIRISSPGDGQTYTLEDTIVISGECSDNVGLFSLEFSTGRRWTSVTSLDQEAKSQSFSFSMPASNFVTGPNTIHVRVTDKGGNQVEESLVVNIQQGEDQGEDKGDDTIFWFLSGFICLALMVPILLIVLSVLFWVFVIRKGREAYESKKEKESPIKKHKRRREARR